MFVTNHGGRCCGIKHIFGLSETPSSKVAALSLQTVYHGASAEMTVGACQFPGPREMESGKDRLIAVLEYLDSKKSSHLMEIVVSNSQNKNWKNLLLELGFQLVSEFRNSNTLSTVHVYHRITPLKKTASVRKSLVRFI